MSKISLLIFSYDRAAQLCLLLDSIERNAPGEFDIRVILKSSSPEFTAGYEKLGDYYPDLSISLEVDSDVSFKELTLDAMNKLGDNKFMSFLTDDCLFYRESPLQELKNALLNHPNNIGVANLRVGLDTKIDCYFNGKLLPNLTYAELGPNLFYWNHRSYPANSAYSYVNTLDGGIWRTPDILDLVKNTEFKNPNELESGLSGKTHWLKPLCVAGNQQSVVAIPANSVSMWNQAGGQFPYSTKDLNEKFLGGFSIDLNAAVEYCRENISCTHGEIPFDFIKR